MGNSCFADGAGIGRAQKQDEIITLTYSDQLWQFPSLWDCHALPCCAPTPIKGLQWKQSCYKLDQWTPSEDLGWQPGREWAGGPLSSG